MWCADYFSTNARNKISHRSVLPQGLEQPPPAGVTVIQRSNYPNYYCISEQFCNSAASAYSSLFFFFFLSKTENISYSSIIKSHRELPNHLSGVSHAGRNIPRCARGFTCWLSSKCSELLPPAPAKSTGCRQIPPAFCATEQGQNNLSWKEMKTSHVYVVGISKGIWVRADM